MLNYILVIIKRKVYKDMRKECVIVPLSSSKEIAKKISNETKYRLVNVTTTKFSDGEIMVSLNESVRQKKVYIIQSTNDPVNDNLMELLITIDAVKRSDPEEIVAIIPYFGYARQDRRAKAREPITAKLVANMLEAAGATRILSLDLHAPQIQGFFDIPVDNLMGAPLLADYFLSNHLEKGAVVVSPDHGGVTRARKLAEFLKAPIAIVDKRRPKANVAEVMNIIGDVSGKRAIIIDDMIDTAGTITLAAQALIDAGATEVYASATHAVLSGPAIDRLNNSKIKSLVLTDSINQPEEKKIDKLQLVSVGPLMGDAIKLIEQHQPVSPLFNTRYREN